LLDQVYNLLQFTSSPKRASRVLDTCCFLRASLTMLCQIRDSRRAPFAPIKALMFYVVPDAAFYLPAEIHSW
jgi:hypothetical protein